MQPHDVVTSFERGHVKKTYECWSDSDEGCVEIAFFPVDDGYRNQLSKHARLLYTFEATSWEDAMTEHHKRQGWEPYRPS